MQAIPGKVATIMGSACFVLLSMISVKASAAPLSWNTGIWGDTWQTSITADDSDGDGVPDSQDAFPSNAADWADFDNDGTGNYGDIDDDNDGLLDFPDPDDDNDNLTDLAEITHGSDPLNRDTDGDGLFDGNEVSVGRSPVINEAAVILPIITD